MKKLLCPIFLAILTIFSIALVNAQADIASDVEVSYTVQEDGLTNVSYEITLRNIFTDRYAKSYTLQLQGTNPEEIYALEGEQALEFTTQTSGQTKQVTITFPDAVVGKDKTRTFNVTYKDKSLASKNGDVWDVSIPRLGSPEAFRTYDVSLIIPDSFGDPAYIFPTPSDANENNFTFSKGQIASTGINAAFGKFQTYELKLKYHLENPLHQSSFVEVAIPPDTSYQKIYLQQIDPTPDKLRSDEDGNWIASYSLDAREQLEVNLLAHAQVFNSPVQTVEMSEEFIAVNTQATEYWQTQDETIKALAAEYRTPRAIYDYVIRTLEYDNDRVTLNADRMGAVEALNNPGNALCMEFTDVFIAIARAAGIPAREVNGYAFSDNPTLQPLSLVTDVLHSWPEYWDANRKAWIAVDPTWGDTTGGIDYFNNMDLKHIAFAIHGKDDSIPYPAGSYKLGAYPEKNVEVNIGSIPEVRASKPEITIKPVGGFPLTSQRFEITVINPGPSALYDLPLVVLQNDKKETHRIEALLPYGNYTVSTIVPVGVLAMDMPEKIQATSGGVTTEFETQKADIAIYHSATLLLFILAATVGLFIYLGPSIKLPAKPWKRS